MKKAAKYLTGFLLLLGTFALQLHGQKQIRGTVAGKDGNPIAFANVLLLSAQDSVLIKGQITNEDGTYILTNLSPGKYMVAINLLGFEEFHTNAFDLFDQSGAKDLPLTTLNESSINLITANVVAKKPLFEQHIDRLVINVANTITSAGSTALEVLERSPGVIVNRQNNAISISGKSGVVVMINGRINYMSVSAVVQLLAGMSADNIEKIELITTPPAGFDAEGNAGFINIVLKKSLDDGLSGSGSLSAGYGKGETGNANINFNYRQGKLNLYGDYAYMRNAQEQVFSFHRSVILEDEMHETATLSARDPLQRNHNGRLGLDWQLTKNTVIGALLSSYDTKWTMDAMNNAVQSTNQVPQGLIDIQLVELNQWRHYGSNLNLQHQFQDGSVFSANADFLYYRDNNPAEYQNTYSDGNGNFNFVESTRSGKITPIKIAVSKLDYERKLGEKAKIGTGLKGTISSFTNDVSVASLQGQIWEPNPDLTAKYKLHEKVLAAYTDLDLTLDSKTSMKLGLRYEYTDSNLGSVESENIVDRQYGRFFPSFFLSRKLSEQQSMNFSYSRRITRPTFNDMAPFVIFMDPTTFFSGNPALQPATSNNLKLDYQLKSTLISLQYSHEDSTIVSFQSRILPGTNDQLIYAENLKGQKTVSLSVSMPFSPKPWWNMFVNASGIYQKAGIYYEGILNLVELQSLNVYSSQTFTFPKDFTLEVNGFFNSGSLFGAFVVKPFGAVNAGLQKKFRNNGSTLRLGMDNIFNTMVMNMSSDVPDLQQHFDGRVQFNNPTVKLTYSRNFGNGKMKSQRKRGTGSDEERKRVK